MITNAIFPIRNLETENLTYYGMKSACCKRGFQLRGGTVYGDFVPRPQTIVQNVAHGTILSARCLSGNTVYDVTYRSARNCWWTCWTLLGKYQLPTSMSVKCARLWKKLHVHCLRFLGHLSSSETFLQTWKLLILQRRAHTRGFRSLGKYAWPYQHLILNNLPESSKEFSTMSTFNLVMITVLLDILS